MAKAYIGCSGFTYNHWRNRFYPEKLPQSQWFDYYCSVFATVELNVTFYRLVKPETFDHWRENSPRGFSFCVKGSRFITHVKRLADPEKPLERFFETVLHLEDKLSAVLWQFSPSFTRDTSRFKDFVTAIKQYPVRNAFEFRNESWCTDEIFDLCRGAGAVLCMADSPKFIDKLPETGEFIYIRRHGYGGKYQGLYSRDELAADAERIRRYLKGGRDVHIYFNNDIDGNAPKNALELIDILGDRVAKKSEE